MRAFEIKIVSRAIEIDRRQINAVKPVLLAVGLELHEKHLLRQAIRSVRFFGIAIPEILLAERNRSEFWIGADGAGTYEFFNALTASGFDDTAPHRGIIVKKDAARVLAIFADAFDHCGKMYENIRPRFLEKTQGLSLFAQVIFAAARHDDFATA